MGIIDSLSAGYRFLIRRLDLLLIPVLLDLFLWRAPWLSLAPLLGQVAAFYREIGTSAGFPAEMQEMTGELSTVLMEMGQRYNLFYALVSSALLRVPSMLIMLEPPADAAVIGVASPWVAMSFFVLLNAIGLCLGVAYLGLLAKALPIGGASKQGSWLTFVTKMLRHWSRVLLLVIVGSIVALAVLVPVSLFLSMLILLVPGLAAGLMVLLGMATSLILLYFYFVTVGMVMDDLGLMAAVGQSFRLVQSNFSRVVGFAVLSFLISWGIGELLLDITAFDPPFGILISIAANAFIGTGLALALLVFYRSHVLLARGEAMEAV